mmetsp:Transcript_4672/g.7943  ORF Transcript_4672/g.7943 Transcript_4672/m.7943 type:complete len:405 (-) Transcript_4672:284-1498(-)
MATEIPLQIWSKQLAGLLLNKNGESCVEFLDSNKITVSGIAQLNSLSQNEQVPAELSGSIGNAFDGQLANEQKVNVARFLRGYLHTLRMQGQAKIKGLEKTSIPSIFNVFLSECFQVFYVHVLQLDHFDGKWVAPLLDHLTHILCDLALEADAQIAERGQEADVMGQQFQEQENDDDEASTENRYLELSQQHLRKVVQKLKSQRKGADSREYSQYFIRLRMIRLWFKLGNYKYSKLIFQEFESNLERMVEEQLGRAPTNINCFEILPLNLRILFHYYKGRFHLYNNEDDQSRACLKEAFDLMQRSSEAEVKTVAISLKQIVRYLVPSEMLIGIFPSKQFLDQFNLTQEYYLLGQACQRGELKEFEDNLDKHMSTLIQSGVFLAVEKLRHLTLRNMVRSVNMELH